MRGEGFLEQSGKSGVGVLGFFQHVGKLPEGFGHRGVEHGVGQGDVLGGAGHTELKLVTGKGKRGGAVAVGGILAEHRNGGNAQIHHGGFGAAVGFAVHNRIDQRRELLTHKYRDDGRRRLVCTQPVVVAGIGHRHAQQLLVIVHRLEHGGQNQQKLHVLARGFAGIQQVFAVGGQRPVVVLARAVDAGIGLFVQQADQAVLFGNLFHELHHQQVLVHRDVGVGIDRGQLMLRGGHLVVLGFGIDAHAPECLVQIGHKRGNAGFEGTEIVVLQLLPLGRRRAEQRAPGKHKVGPAVVHGLVNDKVFLLGPHIHVHTPGGVVAENAQNAQRLGADGVHRAQQRGFGVQRLPRVGAEGRGDVERAVLDKGIGGGVPGRVSPRLKGGAQTSGGEGGSVGLPADQLLARKLHHHLAGAHRRDEGVVLFGRHAGQRLEPVGVMGGPLFHGPVLHGVGYHIGNRGVNLLACGNGAGE